MSTHEITLQMAAFLHSADKAILETVIVVPDWLTFHTGMWLSHPRLPSAFPVASAGFKVEPGQSGADGRLYVILGRPHRDVTMTLDEWLQAYPHWKVAEDPLLAFQPVHREDEN